MFKAATDKLFHLAVLSCIDAVEDFTVADALRGSTPVEDLIAHIFREHSTFLSRKLDGFYPLSVSCSWDSANVRAILGHFKISNTPVTPRDRFDAELCPDTFLLFEFFTVVDYVKSRWCTEDSNIGIYGLLFHLGGIHFPSLYSDGGDFYARDEVMENLQTTRRFLPACWFLNPEEFIRDVCDA